jgi:hypothetical protein
MIDRIPDRPFGFFPLGDCGVDLHDGFVMQDSWHDGFF